MRSWCGGHPAASVPMVWSKGGIHEHSHRRWHSDARDRLGHALESHRAGEGGGAFQEALDFVAQRRVHAEDEGNAGEVPNQPDEPN